MIELKGIITEGETIDLTCCYPVQDINIGDVSLWHAIDDNFNIDIDASEGSPSESDAPKASVRYVILPTPPAQDIPFEQQSAEVVIQMLYGEYIYGCYSEYTCGMGDFNYFINENRSIFDELRTYVGQYIHIVI